MKKLNNLNIQEYKIIELINNNNIFINGKFQPY